MDFCEFSKMSTFLLYFPHSPWSPPPKLLTALCLPEKQCNMVLKNRGYGIRQVSRYDQLCDCTSHSSSLDFGFLIHKMDIMVPTGKGALRIKWKNKIQTWKNLKCTLLSDRGQSEEAASCVIPTTRRRPGKRRNYRDSKNISGCRGEERKGGQMNRWNTGIVIFRQWNYPVL